MSFESSHLFYVVCTADEKGLLVVEIKENLEFDGYKGNQRQNEKKILKNVFKKGDAYFNSGDLFTLDKDYFVYFKDRTGDTFRFSILANPFASLC